MLIDYLESQVASRSLMPVDKEQYRDALQFIGTALIVMEKRAQLIYETGQRPQEKQRSTSDRKASSDRGSTAGGTTPGESARR